MNENTALSAEKKNICKVVSIANQKGGVAKTTTTVNLGIGLAKEGKKVLVIDADPQGSLTASLGFRDQDSIKYTLATVMSKIKHDENFDPEEGLLHHSEGIDLLPSNIELANLEVDLAGEMSREYILKQLIEVIRDRYEYILIDCAPSLGMVTINALAASDSILIPCQAGYLPTKGLAQLIKTINKMKKKMINPTLRIEGILLTMVDMRTNYAKEIIELIEKGYGTIVPIFKREIPLSTRVAECSSLGVSIYKNDPRGKAAMAYKELTREILNSNENGR